MKESKKRFLLWGTPSAGIIGSAWLFAADNPTIFLTMMVCSLPFQARMWKEVV